MARRLHSTCDIIEHTRTAPYLTLPFTRFWTCFSVFVILLLSTFDSERRLFFEVDEVCGDIGCHGCHYGERKHDHGYVEAASRHRPPAGQEASCGAEGGHELQVLQETKGTTLSGEVGGRVLIVQQIKCNRLKPSCEACQVFNCACVYGEQYDSMPRTLTDVFSKTRYRRSVARKQTF